MAANRKVVGLFSWLKACESVFFEETLKLALLWFDDLVMQSPRADLVTDKFPEIMEKLGAPNKTAAYISSVIHPVQEFRPEYTFPLGPEVWSRDSHVSDATYVALTKYFERHEGPWPSERALMREVVIVGCGVIDAICLVSELSRYFDCFMLPTHFEHAVLAEVMKPHEPRSAFDLFSEVARYRLPKLRDFSWERIVELRHHRFVSNFRRTLSELQVALRCHCAQEVRSIFDDIEKRHIKELLSLLRPASTAESFGIGIATNFPVPLDVPVNPLGVLHAIWTATRNKMLADKYGWLYFLYELT
jgi:hypothetical protein